MDYIGNIKATFQLTPIQEQYLEVFRRVKPHLDNIREHLSDYPDYKGWSDIESPIFKSPDILFIGINRGPGWYLEHNGKIEDFPTPWRSELNFIKKGNARKGEWWDLSDGRKPKNKVIVLMGKTVEHDLWDDLAQLKAPNGQPYPRYCIDRRGWNGKERIVHAANRIYEKLQNA